MQLPSKASEKPAGFYPAQYVCKPQPPVTAVQWLGNREQVNALFVGISPRVAYVHAGAEDTLVLTTAQVSATVQHGDWIVKRSEKDIYLVLPNTFRDLYVPATTDNVKPITNGTPIGDQQITFTDVAGDLMKLHAGVLRNAIFMRSIEREHAEVSLLFTPADARGIADTLYKLANEIEGISDGR